jgi:hypothetical protein
LIDGETKTHCGAKVMTTLGNQTYNDCVCFVAWCLVPLKKMPKIQPQQQSHNRILSLSLFFFFSNNNLFGGWPAALSPVVIIIMFRCYFVVRTFVGIRVG